MNPIIISRFDACRPALLKAFIEAPPGDYTGVFKILVSTIAHRNLLNLDPDRITVIDHGDYQGTLLFVVANAGYQPNTFWTATCAYGTCSGCDTMCGIRDGRGTVEENAKDYLTLALHLAQSMRLVGGDI